MPCSLTAALFSDCSQVLRLRPFPQTASLSSDCVPVLILHTISVIGQCGGVLFGNFLPQGFANVSDKNYMPVLFEGSGGVRRAL